MPTKDDSWRIPSKFGLSVIGFLLSGAVTFNVWAVQAVHQRPTAPEVERMIEKESPYREDRNMILRSLDQIQKDLHELKRMLREYNGANN
jgi:hypothetical protein